VFLLVLYATLLPFSLAVRLRSRSKKPELRGGDVAPLFER
jgi:hypothetical protein